jgi:hypothetical protein
MFRKIFGIQFKNFYKFTFLGTYVMFGQSFKKPIYNTSFEGIP